jgi:hypothetical protein
MMSAETEVMYLPPTSIPAVAPIPDYFIGGSAIYLSSAYFGQYVAADRFAEPVRQTQGRPVG